VRGSARLDPHAARAQGKLVLSGTALDDVDRPLARIQVALALVRSANGTPVSFAAFAESPETAPEPCVEGSARPVLERADLLVLPTDDAGRFCVRLAPPTDRYIAHLEARTAAVANGLLDTTAIDLPVDLALESITLRFDPEQPVLSIDQPATALQVVASTEDDGVTTPASGLAITLSSEAGATLGTGTTDGAGRARFSLPTESLGPPGPGEVRVSFAGDAHAGPTTHTMRIEKRTQVDLSAPEAIEGRLPAGSPDDGIAVRIVARARYASRPHAAGTLPGGAVEARLADVNGIVGAAPLEEGRARVTASFSVPTSLPSSGEVALRLRYIPDAPWFVPGAELRLELPIRPPSVWTRLPLLLAGGLVLVWLVAARVPGAFSSLSRSSQKPRPPRSSTVRPHVAVVRAASRGDAGWTGRVIDAHDGYGVPMARVAIERRGFERVDSIAQTLTDAAGQFVLPAVDVRPGDELAVEGRLHAGLRHLLPPAGELRVALVSRRRALLERLVSWARRRGRPFDTRPEPTPGHVRRAAASEFAVARWADAVERAAYGGSAVDQDVQAEVDRLAPPEAPDAPNVPHLEAGQPKPSDDPAPKPGAPQHPRR
jgi:hypothetical protein